MVRKSILYLWSQDQMIKFQLQKLNDISVEVDFVFRNGHISQKGWNYFFLQREATRTKISWSRYVWVIL